jgi:hypothetical protein
MYRSDNEKWEDAVIIESESGYFSAREGSSLAATSTRDIRLFYQASDGDIKGIRESGDEWMDRKLASFQKIYLNIYSPNART